MPTTRSQDAAKAGVKASEGGDRSVSATSKAKKSTSRKKAALPSTKQEQEPVEVGEKRKDTDWEGKKGKQSPRKKAKTEDTEEVVRKEQVHSEGEEGGMQITQARNMYEAGAC